MQKFDLKEFYLMMIWHFGNALAFFFITLLDFYVNSFLPSSMQIYSPLIINHNMEAVKNKKQINTGKDFFSPTLDMFLS